MRKIMIKVLTVLVALFIVGLVVPKSYVYADGTARVSTGGSWTSGSGDDKMGYTQFNVSLSGVDVNGGPISFSISLNGSPSSITSSWGCDSCTLSGNSVSIYISGGNLYSGGAGFIVNYPDGSSCSVGSSSVSFSQTRGTPTNTPTPTPTPVPTFTPVPTQPGSTNPTTPSQPAATNPTTPAQPGATDPTQPQAPVVVVVDPVAPADPGAPAAPADPGAPAAPADPGVPAVDPAAPAADPAADPAAPVEETAAPAATQAASGNNSGGNAQVTTEAATIETEETTVPIVIIDVNGNEIIVTPTPTPTPFPRYIAMFVDPNDSMSGFPWWIVNALLIAGVVIARLVALKIQGARGADYIIDFVPFGIVRGIVDNTQYAQDKRRRMKEPEKNNGYMEREHNHTNASASAAEAAKAAQAARAEFAKAAAERNAAQAANNAENGLKAPVKRPASASVNHTQTSAAAKPAPSASETTNPSTTDASSGFKPSPFKRPGTN